MNFLQQAQQLEDFLLQTRRDIHMHPELSGREERTSKRVRDFLRGEGIEVLPVQAGTSVAALIRGGRPGRTAALRADMDALPIEEASELPYRSTEPGVMHACGHDVHVTCLMGAARMLQAHADELQGNVLLLFQAAEEINQGARTMVEAGVLDGGVDALFALHTNTTLEAGQVAFLPGPAQASADMFHITIHGRGGHGAFPHTAVDPVAIGAQLVVQLQSVVARNVDPIDTGVISVCEFHAGSSCNVIPETAELSGTIRALAPSVRSLIRERMDALCAGVERGFDCRCTLEWESGCPAIVNDPDLTVCAQRACSGILGPECVRPIAPAMVGDDMAFFLELVPGVLGALGVRNEAAGIVYGNHNPRFAVDERCLTVGAACMAQMAWDYLNS